MRICASHHQYETYRNKIDELRFPSNAMNSVLNFLQNHQEHRIIIEVKNIDDCGITKDKLYQLVKENPQLVLDFYQIADLKTASEIIPGRYMYHYPVNMWELIQVLINYQVSDILIGAPLTFQMNHIKSYIKEPYGIKIRVCPHMGSLKHLLATQDGIEGFWILPQHLHLYEDIVDVIDILESNILRESTLIDVYSKQDYNLSLSLLIENIKSNLNAVLVDEDIARIRMNCGQKCMIHKSLCHSCDVRIRTKEKLFKQLNKKSEES